MSSEITNFIPTREYLQFTWVCEICKKYKFICICYGNAGVGKTWAAGYYTKWDIIEAILPPEHLISFVTVEEIEKCDTVLYTASYDDKAPIRGIGRRINKTCSSFNQLIEDVVSTKGVKKGVWNKGTNHIKLVIIDEVDRLTPSMLEQIRDIYDRNDFGMMLIGMPGLEKKLPRFPQLYSRVGYVHNYKPLAQEEKEGVVKKKLQEFNIKYDLNKISSKEAFAEIIRITRGNFRLIKQLLVQCEIVMTINDMNELTFEVVEAAGQNLMHGIRN